MNMKSFAASMVKVMHGFAAAALVITLAGPIDVQAQTTEEVFQNPEMDALQLSSSGHMINFRPNGLELSNGTYVYQVDFDGTAGVVPENLAADADIVNESDELSGQVSYRNLWPGITLSYDAPQGGILRSTYFVEPYADADLIHLNYNAPLEILADGRLAVEYESGTIHESAPVAWQVVEGMRQPVPVAFDLLGSESLGFRLGEYNPALPLFIDPSIEWHTFLGGSADDVAESMVIDSSGNLYVSGFATGGWGGTPLRAHAGDGSNDTFVAKLNSSGSLQWHTFLGTTGDDMGRGMAIYGSLLYVTGVSIYSWGSPVESHSNSGVAANVFVAQLDTGTGNINWNTFVGGTELTDTDRLSGADANGVVIAGTSEGSWGSPVRAYTPGDGTEPSLAGPYSWDIYAARVNSSGHLVWNTFLGGGKIDNAFGAHLADGAVYITGYGNGAWGTPVREFSPSCLMCHDGMVAKLDASTGALIWHTFLGGLSGDTAQSALLDGSNLYVIGESNSSWGDDPVRPHAGGTDTFVANLDPATGSLKWHTFLGSNSSDYGDSMTLSNGILYVSGTSFASWGSAPNPEHSSGSNADLFLALLDDSSGDLLSNGFFGGSESQDEVGRSAIVSGGGYTYLAGMSTAGWGSPLSGYSGGNHDVLVVKVKPDPVDLIDTSLSRSVVSSSQTDVGTLSPTNGIGPFVFSLQQSGDVCDATNGVDNASFSISGSALQRNSDTTVGTYHVCVQVVDTTNANDQHAYTINVVNPLSDLALDNLIVPDDETDVGDFSATGGTAPLVYTLETSGAVCNSTNGTNNASFSISGTTLQRNSGTTAGTYDICAQVEDSYGITTQKAFTITVAMAINSLTLDNLIVPDDKTDVGDFSVTGGTAPLTYTFETGGDVCNSTNGTDNASFSISGTTLQRNSGTTVGTYDICAQAEDTYGYTTQQIFTITVANAVSDLALDNLSVPDDRTNVGDFSATGGTAPMAYSLETSGDVCDTTNGADNASFSISATTLQRNSGTKAGTYQICAQVEDTYGITTQETFTIRLSAAPSDLTLSNTTIIETQQIVGTLGTVDGQPLFTYSLETSGSTCTGVNGADNSGFEILGNALKRNPATLAGDYDVCIQTLDEKGSIFQRSFSITVTADTAPAVGWSASLSSTHLIDGDGPGTVAGSMQASISGVTYTLIDQAEFPLSSNFSISADGKLTLTAAVDYSVERNYPLRILASAPDGSKAYLDYVITVMQDGTANGAVGVEDTVDTTGVITIDVLSNDFLSSGATSWDFHEIIEYPQHGTAEIGSVIYTPEVGYSGEDNVSYRACDNLGLCVTALVTINVKLIPLPETGFAPGRVSQLPAQPENRYYHTYENILLDIPALDLQSDIIGVPMADESWDLTWLGGQVGWLEGSAFPTREGNSILTGHVYDENGLPGPFVDLHTLRYNDRIVVNAWGQRYIYAVRSLQQVRPDHVQSFRHEELPWLTLVTCRGYDEQTDSYRYRIVVRAVLVAVE